MKIKFFLIIFLFFPVLIYAQQIDPEIKGKEMEKALSMLERENSSLASAKEYTVKQIEIEKFPVKQALSERDRIIEETLSSLELELSVDCLLGRGEQTFEVIDDAGRKISRLVYPQRGKMFIANAEIRFTPEFSIGGSFGSSRFKEVVSTDTDWLPAITGSDVWWESNSSCKTQLDNYNINLYYRFLDLDSSSERSELNNLFRLSGDEKFSLDLFTGYQWQKGRYRTIDLKDTVENWAVVSDGAIEGEDSFYKIKYRGPRIGLRGEFSLNKWFSTRLSGYYSWLTTKAFGWWNLRDYSFWEEGSGGNAVGLNLEMIFHFTPNWFLGAGYKYDYYSQKEMTESGLEAGVRYSGADIIRDADNKLYGPTFKIGCNW